MSQRNPMNDRYREENRGGKTRKSAASAKPTTGRAATVRDPAPKTKKQKKQEAREREAKREERMAMETPNSLRLESLPEYKRLRRLWWICLGSAIALIAVSLFVGTDENLTMFYVPCIVLGYMLVIVAFYIDFGKIRKLRKVHEQTVLQSRSKEVRAVQKKARAEARAQQKAAEEQAASEPDETPSRGAGLLARITNKFPSSKKAESADATEGEAKEEEQK